jgi:Tfp pilus assembly protein PilF
VAAILKMAATILFWQELFWPKLGKERNTLKRIVLALFMMVVTLAAAQEISGAASADLSPVARRVEAARKAIAAKPKEYTGYNLLANALVLCARETSDISLYTQAEDAVKRSLELAPNNFETEKIQVSILLGEHEFPAALESARKLNKRVPDDVMVYGMLTDANVELGNYNDAEESAQWMINLRRGNRPALIKAAHLRELFGDAEGAYEVADLALQSTIPSEAEERAHLLTLMGHFRFAAGNIEAAEKLFLQALTVFPKYPGAMGDLAQLRIAQRRDAEAVELLLQRYQEVPRAANLYDLAEALQLAGRDDDAKRAFADFETQARLESSRKDNANHELVFYYADHARLPGEALKVAQQEYSWRHDVCTLDAYAWALHVNGQEGEARKTIEDALAVGIRDARLFRHAGEIALRMGDVPAAENYLKQSVDLNTVDSEQARRTLAKLTQPYGQ